MNPAGSGAVEITGPFRHQKVVHAMTELRKMLARSAARWVGAATLAVAMAGTAAAAGPMAAQAAPVRPAAHAAAAHATKSVVIVKVVTRRHFGKILATTKGRALYVLPHGSCGAGCLSFWPRLVMPKGKTIPKGTTCLSTAKFGKHGLQVTYRKMRLYTFTSDSGTSVNGNGVAGFKVAKLVKCR
jgi:hypothetical protein